MSELGTAAPSGAGRRRAALFLISFCLIAFQLATMRVFSVGSWSNFGSMVISIALLGYGISGVGITFFQERVRKSPDAWLAGSAILLPASLALCYSLAQQVPFNPIFLISQPIQLLYISIFYVLFALPYLVGSVYIAAAFMVPGERMQSLYFWNMVGSGLGGLALILATYLLKTADLIYPVVAVAAGSALLALPWGKGSDARPKIAALAVSLASFALVAIGGGMRVSVYKDAAQARLMFSDLEVKHAESGPLGEYEVLKSDRFHFAPGLSDNAVFYIDEMPKNAFWGMYIDGNGPIGIMRRLDESTGEDRYIDFLPMSAPYALMDKPEVLLIRLGGGIAAFTAFHHGASSVSVVEPNPVIARIMREVPTVRDFTGDLLRDPRVRLHEEEPRAFCSRDSSGTFDLVELSLIDSVGLSNSAGYSISENYYYTVEAIVEYLKRLGPDGILSITVWNHLSPPRNVPKLIATVAEALRRSGYAEPAKHVYGFDLIYSTATILVKKSPLSQDDLKKLDRFCARMSFNVFHSPARPAPESDFKAILAAYRDKFVTKQGAPGEEENPEGSIYLDVDELYAHASRWALEGRADELYAGYLYDIRPTTDDRPFYSVYMKPETAPIFLDKMSYASEDWSYFLSWATLFQAVGFGLLIALMPLLKRRREGQRYGAKRTAGVLVYYACLGAGYMLVEIFLMQKLVFFLAEPVFSTSIVITTMLIISGLGSLYSERISPDPAKRVRVAVIAISAMLAFYAFALSPILGGLLGLPFWAKIPIAVAAIAPAAFFMGMPYPNGLSRLGPSAPPLLPWAYGVNGALSVTGSILAQIIAIHSGFVWVLSLAFALYALAALIFKANEGRPAAA